MVESGDTKTMELTDYRMMVATYPIVEIDEKKIISTCILKLIR